MTRHYVVNAFWDGEAGVWVASSDDIPGLASEAQTLEALIERVTAVAPELLDDNAHLIPGGRADDEKLSFQVLSDIAAHAA